MIRYLTTLVLAIALLTAVKASCETETNALSDCIDGNSDCQACFAVDGNPSWTPCQDLVDQICNTLDQCGTSCESCMKQYNDWATCYVENLPYPYQGDAACSLNCNQGGRVDTSSAQASFQLGFVFTFILAVVA